MKKNVLSALLFAALCPFSSAQALLLQQAGVPFDIDPATLKVSVSDVVVNAPQAEQITSQLKATPAQASWYWPARNTYVTATAKGNDLQLSFTSDRPQVLSWFTLPPQIGVLQLAIGEGSRIPLDNADWQTYLIREQSTMDTNFDLKLPLWGLEHQGKVYSWIMLTPFSNKVSFAKVDRQLNMQAAHTFNQFNQGQSFDVLLHVGNSALSGAQRYREYLQQSGQFSTLREKMAVAPEGQKLIGASHLYLWGNGLLAPEDVQDWAGLMGYLQSPAGSALWQKLDTTAKSTLQQRQGREPEGWQKASLMESINAALVAQFPLAVTPDAPSFLQAQQQQALAVRQLAQRLLAKWLIPADQWGQGLSAPVINALAQVGLPRLWLGTDNWTAAFLQPQAIAQAKKAGYLVTSYDSYDTGIPPGLNDSWLTAQLPGDLREKCAIVRADGTKKPGFGGEGYYLNPACVLPFSQTRMRELIQLAGLNTLFLDVDGTGMVSDDYQPQHPTGAAQMAEARNARMAWFANTLKLPLGSEDGNAVTARYISFAHGMETWGFGWRDNDMRHNRASPYFLGAWWPNAQPATFFSPAKVKPLYRTVAFDPRYRLPLYQAVFHDAVINTHHWTMDNLKFSDVKTTRTLLSQLYNTPPLFNLSRGTLAARLPEIVKADARFRPLHAVLWDKALTDFRWLDNDGWVQQTTFSDGSVLRANFSDRRYQDLAPKSLQAQLANGQTLNFTD
ncbi:hypothetical protein CIG19_02510 [Enterobacterales bacterium CwR94]|nr:hypothetical protein CIG19_02510 [Enterobacterales bacterium CwR94]